MPRCGRLACFHVRLEAAAPDGPVEDSCGVHLAEVVQELARRAGRERRNPARVVVYAMTDARRANRPEGPFDRLALGAIPI